MMKNEVYERAGHEANACPKSIVSQYGNKKVLFDCPPSGAASDCALCPRETQIECRVTRRIAQQPIYCADTMQAQAEARIRGRVA